MAELRRTPLNAVHRESGAKMVAFGGWEMPVEYTGLIAEHLAVRKAAGLFDVSHMGEFEVSGPGALAFLQKVTANNVAKLRDGQAQYSALPLANGAPVDDVIVYRCAPDRFLLVVNAANLEKDWGWLRSQGPVGCELRDRSDDYALLAPEKGDFVGRPVLEEQKKSGPPRKLVGFEVTGRGIARHGYPVYLGEAAVGAVTSGSYAPFLQKNIGLVYLPSGKAAPGTGLEVEIRAKRVPARVVPTPFYKRPR